MAITITRDDIKRRLQLPAGSVACTMANAGDLVTAILHGLAVGDVIVFGTTAWGVTAGTLYWVRTITSPDVFEISATRGGALFAITGDGANTYSQRTELDADLDALIVEMQAGLTGIIHATALTAHEAACKFGMIDVIAGEALSMIRREQGYTEQVGFGGVVLGSPLETGKELTARGMKTLEPFTHLGYLRTLAAQSAVTTTDVAQESHDPDVDPVFAPDSAEYSYGSGF